MSDTKKYEQISLTTEDVVKKLEGNSPLQVSKVLIDMELFDQLSSLEVMDEIYKDFDSKQNVIDELVSPIGLSLLDSIITHKDLKLDRTGITASRVWQEVKGFDYSNAGVSSEAISSKQQLEGLRGATANKRGNVRASQLNKHKIENTKTNGTITNEIDGSDLLRDNEKTSTLDGVNTDHLVSADKMHKQFSNNVFLKDSNMKDIVNHFDNLASISEAQNKSKGSGTFLEIKDKKTKLEKNCKDGTLSEADKKALDSIIEKFPGDSLDKGIELENEAVEKNLSKAQAAAYENLLKNKSKVLKKAGAQAGVQTAFQAVGHAMILLIKPLFYELNDSIKFGFEKGVNKKNITEGLKFRFNRLSDYVIKEIIPTLAQGIKDFFTNFFKVLIEGVLGLVTGLFKMIMKVVTEGFSALIGAFKILKKSSEEMSSSEKADAILKLFASTVVTFVIFYFETTIMSALPNNFIKDIALALLSGVASTIVVYALDKIDIFSVKPEQRAKRVKEIFDMRILQIKDNTDAFEKTSIERLAKDRLQFRSLSESIQSQVEDGNNVNDSVYNMADFMGIDLKIKNTESFMELLGKKEPLVVA